MKKYDNGGSVLVDSEGRPVRFGYESDEEYEKRAGPNAQSPRSLNASQINTRSFFRRLFGKPSSEKYREIDALAKAKSFDQLEREPITDIIGVHPAAYAKMRRAQMEKEVRDETTRLDKRAKAKAEDEAPTARSVRLGYLAKGGKVSSASKRADGAAQRGKTRGKYI